MRATATDGVACLFRVSVLATTVNPAKTAEPIDMLFGKKTRGSGTTWEPESHKGKDTLKETLYPTSLR